MTQYSTYIPGYGNPNAKLMIVGIAPGSDEVRIGRPFVGPSGNILRQDLSDANFTLDSCYFTNIFKYQLPNNEFKRYQEIGLDLQGALADLQYEINDINPNCILGLGEPVLHSLTGKNKINQWRGSILDTNGKKSVFTWHPAAELHGQGEGQWKSWQRYVRKFDIKRAVEQSQFKEFKLPQRLLHVARSSADVYRYFDKNKHKEFCAVDIESIESIPVCIGFSFDSNEGFCIPLWNTLPIKVENEVHPKKSYNYTLKVSTIPTQDLAFIWQILSKVFLNIKIKFIGQNFKYDEAKINNLGFYLHSLFWDTMIGAHCISSEMPKALAFLTSINTEEPYYKDEGRDFIPGKDKIETFFLYNCKDVCVTREIFDVQYKELKEISLGIKHATWRMKLHKAYLEVDKIGFKTDEEARKLMIHKYVDQLVNLEAELKELTGEVINIGSPKQVAELLYDKLRIPVRKGKGKQKSERGTGEQVLTALIGNVIKDKNKIRVCEIILDWRRVDKSLGYLKANPDYDGRMKTNYRICGTENFRTSTNILEPPVRPTKVGWAFQTVSKHGDIGNDLRTILIADPKYVIVNIDQSQAEARVCSLLADDEETLRDYDRTDKHAYTAAKFFGGNVDQYSKSKLGYECPERFVGKTLRHAYHLDIGKHEAMINVNTDARKYKIPIHISEWRAGECLKILETDTPKIKTVFHASIQEILHSNRRIIGTYGASRYFYDDWGRELFKGAYSFIPQQTVSDKTKQVMLKVQKNLWDVKIVCETHDALTFLILEKFLDERIEEIVSYFNEPISFADCSISRRDLVIPCDVEVSMDNYCDLSKYRRKVA